MSSQDAPRASSGSSARPSGHRSQTSQQQISTIEKSVTHLLVATKQLLEILTSWSRGEATEVNVSDVYVRLGYEFNIACRAFNTIGVDTSDLGPVPDLLRNILEDTLSNEPSQASLEQYLPRIRDIIVNLLQGLKRKQQRLRQRGTRESSIASTSERPSSSASNHTGVERTSSRTNSMRSMREDYTAERDAETTSKMSSAPVMRSTTSRNQDGNSPQRASSARQAASAPTYPTTTQAPVPSIQYGQEEPTASPYESHIPSTPEQTPPRPRPQQQDALAALQRGGELERRASRRFSAYQIQKHLGSNGGGLSMMPPAQHSPIPNRGRDTRDIMNAVRARGSPASRSQTRFGANGSPTRQTRTDRTTETPSLQISNIPNFPTNVEQPALDSPLVKTPEDKLRSSYIEENDLKTPQSVTSATVVNGQSTTGDPSSIRRSIRKVPTSGGNDISGEPSGTAMTLYLQYKTKVKKVVLPNGDEELSIPRLQLAFIDKFAWNTHSNGVDLPEIYIQDPASGVRYELEDLSDIKDQSVLVLNVDAVEEVKRSVDTGMDSLKSLIEGVRSAVTEQQSVLQRVHETQNEAAKDIAKVAAAPTPAARTPLSRSTADRLDEVQSLRRDLAVMRQTYTTLVSDMEASMTSLKAKASNIKSVAMIASAPGFEPNSGRAYVDAGKKTLSDDAEKIINRVDDLQDIVEDLRKDVVSRGVRPLPRQLETVSRDISTATAELKKLQEYIKREKPVWTKIWRNELQAVYDDQKTLNVQEELAADLEDDLEKAAQTFALVEEATKQQNLEKGGPGTPTRSFSSSALKPVNVASNSNVDPEKAKDGVLGEVRALQPNHETRLEAIERAEKNRQRELESRKEGAFKKELGNFVDEGKLKKSGGFEEAERLRKSKDERMRREVWEKMQARAAQTGEAVGPPPDATPATVEALEQAVDDATMALPTSETDTSVSTPTAEVPPPLHVTEEPASDRPESFASAQEEPTPSKSVAEESVRHASGTLASLSMQLRDFPSPVDEISVQPLHGLDTAMSPLPLEHDGDQINGNIVGSTEEATHGAKIPGDFPK